MIGEKPLSIRLDMDLKQMRAKGIFVRGKHYFKPTPRKIVYNEDAMISWIKENDGKHICEKQQDMGELISRWEKGTQAHSA